ncbi:hypothetical protein [Pseudovibrio sp. WM33]|uniref:hypothetical protein n=1 Tax=Pseudovibrio sp. WM33 TaxID=1735585 RepID=UPI0007AEE52A|nr:hypothetical protein [Pseudovibrio sp. WM33]KZL22963.1 hypothetical protein PsWM33_03147 [Pseudovibrio sp. WM33]
MQKDHRIRLEITNNTSSIFTFEQAHLEYGQLADDSEWPKEITADGGQVTVECDEANRSVAGCAGWVKYKSASPENPISIYFAFANPIGNVNKIDAGISGQIYETMTSQLLPVQRIFPTKGSEGHYWAVDARSTNGKTNDARFVIESGDATEIIPENPQLENAAATFDSVNANSGGTGYYFTIHPSVYSHFKGVGAFDSKLIFTHTNVMTDDQQGIYMIGNKIPKKYGGSDIIQATYNTEHDPAWGHPGGVQVCGSYMALTLEKSDKGNTRSEVQIYDVRPTAKNKPMKLLTTIPREDSGVNGAGMTKEKSVGEEKGKYIVIAGDSPGLSVYRSQTTDISAQTQFDLIQLISKKDLPDTFSPEGGFALATQEDGQLFIFTMHGTDRSFGLYRLQIQGDHSASVTEVRAPILLETGASSSADAETRYDDTSNAISLADIKARYKPDTDMMWPSDLGANFRWGKGLQITSSTSIEIFATSRSALAGTFSIATWKAYTAIDAVWWPSINYTTGSSVAIATDYISGCLEMNRGSGGNSNKLYYRVGRADFSNSYIDFGNGIYFTSSSDFAVSMDNKDHCICVHRESGNGNKLYYAVGLADIGARTVHWGNNQNYANGTKVAVAMDNLANCVELHTGSGDDKNNLYYMVGSMNSTAKAIHWGNSYKYDTGADIAVAMDNHGNCIETHRGNPASGNDDKLYYRVGRIDFSKKTISWGDSIQYDSGSDHSIAMDNNGNCMEVHRGHGSSDDLYYRTGKIQFEKKKIDWSESKKYDHGSNLAVTMDNNGHCIEVHRHSEGGDDSNKLYYKIGLPDLAPVD